MFGKNHENSHAAPRAPSASEVARITGGGLVQVIVTSVNPLTFYLFLNDRLVPQGEVESLLVAIEAPGSESPYGGTARAMLARYVTSVSGERTQQQQELFPCTLELVAMARRIVISCSNRDSLDGLWINLGLKQDGSAGEVSGAKALRILLTEGILDAKLTWNDGETEDLLVQPTLN